MPEKGATSFVFSLQELNIGFGYFILGLHLVIFLFSYASGFTEGIISVEIRLQVCQLNLRLV